MVVLHWI